MKLKEKISLEKIFEKEYKDKLVEPTSNKEAVITHFLHNSKNGVSHFYKKDAVKFTKEILQYKYPGIEITNIVAEEALQGTKTLATTLYMPRSDMSTTLKGQDFHSNLFVRPFQKGFPFQSLTQKIA